jgi:hypothetical protein
LLPFKLKEARLSWRLWFLPPDESVCKMK